MEKTFIEKAIRIKAENRFEKEYIELCRVIAENPIGKRLKIKVDNKIHTFVNYHGTRSHAFFNCHEEGATKHGLDNSNISDIKVKLIREYEEEETKSFLSKLVDIKEYLNQL